MRVHEATIPVGIPATGGSANMVPPSNGDGQLAGDATIPATTKRRNAPDLNPALAGVLSYTGFTTTVGGENKSFIVNATPNINEVATSTQTFFSDAEVAPKSETTIKFIPYANPTPGQTKVHIRGKGSGDDAYVTVTYIPETIPKPVETPRAEIKLKGISPALLKKARLVVNEIKEEWNTAQDLKRKYRAINRSYRAELKSSFKYKVKAPEGGFSATKKTKIRYKQTEEKTQLRKLLLEVKQQCQDHPFGSIYGKNSTVSGESLKGVYDQKIDALITDGRIDEELRDDKNFEALVTYLCIKSGLNKRGFLKAAPHGFLNHDDPDLVKKIETIGKYFVVDLLGLDTARKVEDFSGWTNAFVKAGLQKYSKLISVPELLKIIQPGYLDGSNPPIREAKIAYPGKWQSDDSADMPRIKTLAERTVKDAVYAQGVINPDNTINVEKFIDVDWTDVFWKQEYGLRGGLGICEFLDGTLGALELAVPGVFDFFPKHRFKYSGKWDDKNKLTVIDETTKYIVEKKLKLIDEVGNINLEGLKAIKDWSVQYNDECTGCLRRSGVGTAYDALKRVYPQHFGWEVGKIAPGDIRFSGMWDGEAGRRLFQLRFARSIYTIFEKLKEQKVEGFEDHGVEFHPHLGVPLRLPRKDFINLKNYYMSHAIQWHDHFVAFGLTGGFSDVAKSIENAFIILFGEKNSKTECFGSSHIQINDVVDRHPTRTALIVSLLRDVDTEFKPDNIKITGLREKGYEEHATGIEGTCLEPLLAHRPQSNILEQTDALYEALAAAVLPSPTSDKETREKDRCTALEKILIAKYPSGVNKGQLILSDRKLSHFLRTIRDVVIDETNLDDELKSQLKDSINEVRKIKRPGGNPRELLLSACETDKKYSMRTNVLGILNSIVELVFEAVTVHEIRYQRIYGQYSEHFDRIVAGIDITEDKIEDEPVADIEESAEEAVVVDEAEPEKKPDPFDDSDDSEVLGKDWEEVLIETRKICEGRIEEKPEILRALVETSKDRTQSRKHTMDLLRRADTGDLLVQIRMLRQIYERSKMRHHERFDYGSLRAKPLNYTHIDSIIDETGNIIDLTRIDNELFTLLPDYWPIRKNEPEAIPVLYCNNVLYVAVPDVLKAGENDAQSPLGKLRSYLDQNIKDCDYEIRFVNPGSWANLKSLFIPNYSYKQIIGDRVPLKQFIGQAEEDIIVENIAALRRAALR